MANDLKVVPPTVPQTEAEHDTWFRQQVEEGLREADDPNTVWVSNEEVMAEIDEILDEHRDRAKEKKAS